MGRVNADAINEIVADENADKKERIPEIANINEELEDLPVETDSDSEKAEGMNEADNL